MGFPFDEASWTGVSGPIFTGAGSSAPGLYSLIGIVACVVALIVGQMAESGKYKNHK